MTGTEITEITFKRNIEQYIKQAADGPIVITNNNHPHRVMISMDEYMRLLEKDNCIPSLVTDMEPSAYETMMNPNRDE